MIGDMGRKVNKLYDLEFDEVSSVDRPANQHGLIAFSKSLTMEELNTEERGMSVVYAENGLAVDEDELIHGDVVVDSEGNEYVFVANSDEDDDDEDDEDDEDYDDEEDVAKFNFGAAKAGLKSLVSTEGRAGLKRGLSGQMGPGASGASDLGIRVGGTARKYAPAAAATAAGVGVAGGGAYMLKNRKDDEMSKSLGDSVLEQLSKAVSESDREYIIAKALDEVEIAKAEAQAATQELAWLQEERITEAFIAKAHEYNVPGDPNVLGVILRKAADVLEDEELDYLDQILMSIGDAIYDEIGYAGGASNSTIVDQVSGLAAEMVTKSAGDFSLEQASTAMFAANPDAYDAYIAEQNGR